MSKTLQDLEIDLGLLKNRVIECHVTIEVLMNVIVAMKSESTGMDKGDIKNFIQKEIKIIIDKIHGKPD